MEDGQGICSGALISKDGQVLTCAHCFTHGNVKKVFIKTSDGQAYLAELLKIDAEADLALIKTTTTLHTDFFKMSEDVEVGEQVVSFGMPLRLPLIVTVGWVANMMDDKWLIHTAFINPGNSGGPLVNMSGKLIGINELVIRGQGLFVAIPVHQIRTFLSKKEEHGLSLLRLR